MVEIFLRAKKSEVADFEEAKPWEKTKGWSNPFETGEEKLRRERKEERKRRKNKKTRSRSHKHRMTEEEYSEMSSKADSMLDDILGDDLDNLGPTMPQVREGSFGAEDGDSNCAVNRGSSNPFDDSEEEVEDVDGEELNKERYNALLHGGPVNKKFSAAASNPFEVQEGKPNADHPAESGNNPFEDESVADSAALDVEEEKPRLFSQSISDKASSKVNEDLKRQPTDTTEEEQAESETSSLEAPPEEEEEDEEEEDEEEDIVESSKRLLRMADERIQYQQHNDEVKKLRETINAMKYQAEAMSEQLRRAVETKCDLVLAQTEMERCHEQDLIAKDDEIRDMKLYSQELMESQAKNELNFMNEISLLSKRLQDLADKHKAEIAEKDAIILQLGAKLKSMHSGTASEKESASAHTFRSLFLEAGNSPSSAIRV